MVAETPCAIASSAEIVGVVGAVKACDASEIESHKPRSALIAIHAPGFHDVVQRQDFIEIQATVPVAVQATEKVGVDPVVAALPEEIHELIEANKAIPIRIH